jgi:hypothetical protein
VTDRIDKMRKKQQGLGVPAKPQPETRPKGKKKPQVVKERLPHGSVFLPAYDAAAERWHGRLIVPKTEEAVGELLAHIMALLGEISSLENQYVLIQADCKGVFGLLSLLDHKYRKHLKGNKDNG